MCFALGLWKRIRIPFPSVQNDVVSDKPNEILLRSIESPIEQNKKHCYQHLCFCQLVFSFVLSRNKLYSSQVISILISKSFLITFFIFTKVLFYIQLLDSSSFNLFFYHRKIYKFSFYYLIHIKLFFTIIYNFTIYNRISHYEYL